MVRAELRQSLELASYSIAGEGTDGLALSQNGVLGPWMEHGWGSQVRLLRAIDTYWCPQGPDNVAQFLKLNKVTEEWKKQYPVSKRKALHVGNHLNRNFSLSLKTLPVLFLNQS